MKYTSETNPLLARLRYHTSGAIARGERTAITEIASPAAKALANGAKRPAKTSKLNPIVISSAPGGEEFRISPRLSHLKANGVTAAKAAGRAEAMAGYVSKNSFGMPGKAEARLNAANMARYARTHKMLSRADASAIVEFARGDQAAKFIKANKLGNMYPGTVHASVGIENILKKDFRPNTWGSQVIPHLRQRVADEIKHERFVNNLPKGHGRALADTIRRMNEAPIMGIRKKPAPGAYVPAK